ncbi:MULTISPECIES: cobalamin-independent methionine synthase II family protein [Aerococcus]|uniref:Cobalamin-independent methionine synthase II family protein n=1 Tax=Aerococcus sanguinicola TaxID=119206 RepID=A0A5N1GJK3_9LACT|nr:MULTISPECIES: cobalamin-independent methionine synthase II family protein [Aerococcus]KAA9300201.1 cobalamin-independent methionine synthase II family protein [Aerococcus sanguinicola]MDK6369546.1 cobalamin-independent methionine synthase II family protein [Aerococcus sp. UMB9870]MDK6680034.1 cobalamin-independent methionine synthase II family protein [Aerococcus sp. UMB8608]MDK6686085.1 cobalamin-independent methionine synthase II family protein [Aerococcus sp. UMB8623]MDK6939865.1 cobalam
MYDISLMGSMPRSKEILKAWRDLAKDRMSQADYQELIQQETAKVVALQEAYDVDYITSGELGRDNYVSFIADALVGVEMLSMSDMLPYIEDKKAYEDMLEVLDVPSNSIKNAICVGKVQRKRSLVGPELEALHRLTDRKKKITLPGPYLVTRSMWLKGLSDRSYASKEDLAEDVIQVFAEEIAELQKMGVDVIQFDEPVLTEVVFSPGHTRTFMCASLSEKKDPTEELAFAKMLLSRVFETVDRKQSRIGLHVCRGNWSRDESILLSGSYTPLLDLFKTVQADIYYLEYSTDRAGQIDSLFADPAIFQEATLGLGVMNPRQDVLEDKEAIKQRVAEVRQYLAADQIALNPDCGFATFAKKPVNDFSHIEAKLARLKEVRDELRAEYDG